MLGWLTALLFQTILSGHKSRIGSSNIHKYETTTWIHHNCTCAHRKRLYVCLHQLFVSCTLHGACTICFDSIYFPTIGTSMILPHETPQMYVWSLQGFVFAFGCTLHVCVHQLGSTLAVTTHMHVLVWNRLCKQGDRVLVAVTAYIQCEKTARRCINTEQGRLETCQHALHWLHNVKSVQKNVPAHVSV